MVSRFGSILVLTLAAACLGCKGEAPLAYGKSVEAGSAVPLAALLAGDPPPAPGPVVVSGRISQVCRSSGCWFTLVDETGGRQSSVLVDLSPRASFTVPASVVGRRAVVSGFLAGSGDDRRLNAEGLLLP